MMISYKLELSCGCIIKWFPQPEAGDTPHYKHWVHPECDLDRGKMEVVKGYRYIPWDTPGRPPLESGG